MKQLKMQRTLVILLTFGLIACHHQTDNIQLLQNRIDSLEIKISGSYKPGFGEFMSNIQAHHAKLWFAGQNQNWELADFEVDEIIESFKDIQKYQAERKESQLVGMIYPKLDSVNLAIGLKNSELFKRSYTLLTNTCNTCHHAADFEFNVVKIPDKQMFSNQIFKTSQ